MSISKISKKIVADNKGILAADESTETIKKRLASVGLESTEEIRRTYRELLFSTPDIEQYISGVIMFDETIRQGLGKLLEEKGILPGIKVDQGKEPFPGSEKEYITVGLEGLKERLIKYKNLGAKFTKWRALFVIGHNLPTDAAIEQNASSLAKYAKMVQGAGMVPIVEPEVYMQGSHSIEESKKTNYRVLKKVFQKLSEKNIDFSGMLLKPSWVHPGLNQGEPGDEDLAGATVEVLKETIPSSVPGVMFLSGGDSPKNATKHLEAINKQSPNLWKLSFSFGRALQEPVLKAWAGKDENTKKAQSIFLERARVNSEATKK